MKAKSPFGEFVWWQGVVEDLDDPNKMGRARVRCIGYHTEDLSQLPVDLLPWAFFMKSTSGMSSPNIRRGDWVAGFFLDGHEAQQPVIFGMLEGLPTEKPDTSIGFCDPSGEQPKYLGEPTNSRSARGHSEIPEYKSKTAWSNPVPGASTYPFNHVIETEKGALFEIDDTPGNERVCTFHHKGSYVEFLPDGTIVVKSVKNRWDVTFGSHTILVNGDVKLGATGSGTFAVSGDWKFSAGGTMNFAAGGGINLGSGGAMTIVAGGQIGMNGSRFDWGNASDGAGGTESVDSPGDTSAFTPATE